MILHIRNRAQQQYYVELGTNESFPHAISATAAHQVSCVICTTMRMYIHANILSYFDCVALYSYTHTRNSAHSWERLL